MLGFGGCGASEWDRGLSTAQLSIKLTKWQVGYICSSQEWVSEWVSGSRSAVSDSLRPHGLYSLWNSPGQNTGEGSHSQGIFPTQGSNLGLLHCRCIASRFFTSWITREAQEYWSGKAIPSPADLPNPGMELGSRALQADSWPTELWGKAIVGEQ